MPGWFAGVAKRKGVYMPELQWDELDFLECLETVPEVEEDGVWYSYNVIRGGHRLLVTVLPLESVVELSLFPEQAETPLVEFSLFVRGAIMHVNDKRGEYLEFPDSMSPRIGSGIWKLATC